MVHHSWREWRWLAPSLGLVFLLAAHLTANAVWIDRDQTMRAWDQVPQSSVQLRAAAYLRQGGLAALPTALRSPDASHWPRAGYLPFSIVSLVFGQSIAKIRLYNILYFGILILAVFFIGRRLSSWPVGLLAATLVSLYPLIYGASRQFGADFSGCAMVALSLHALLACECFRRPWRSMFFGGVVGLSLLVRPHSLLFILGPAVLCLIHGLRHPGETPRRRILVQAGMGAVMVAAVSAVWWLGNLQGIIGIFRWHQKGSLTEGIRPEWVEGSSLLFYFRCLPWCISPLLALAGGVSVLALACRGLRRWGAGRRTNRVPSQDEKVTAAEEPETMGWPLSFLLCWLASGLVVLSLIRVHFERFLFPVLPAVALITAMGMSLIGRRWLHRVMVVLIVTVAAASWLLCSFTPLEARCALYQHCGSIQYSGPPLVEEMFRVGKIIAQELVRRHADGRDVLIGMRPQDPSDPEPTVLLGLLIQEQLPLVSFTERPFAEYAARPEIEEGLDLNGVLNRGFPRVSRPYQYCYSLGISPQSTAGSMDPVPIDTTLPTLQLLRFLVRRPNGTYRVILWQRPGCPRHPQG